MLDHLHKAWFYKIGIFKSDNCHLFWKKILMPAWIVNSENKRLVHGISGKEIYM